MTAVEGHPTRAIRLLKNRHSCGSLAALCRMKIVVAAEPRLLRAGATKGLAFIQIDKLPTLSRPMGFQAARSDPLVPESSRSRYPPSRRASPRWRLRRIASFRARDPRLRIVSTCSRPWITSAISQ
jgi:hypothetical protein